MAGSGLTNGSNTNPSSIRARFLEGVRRYAPLAVSLAGVGTVSALVVGGLAPFVTSGLTIAALSTWLASIGSNALAGWLGAWAQQEVDRWQQLASGGTEDGQQGLLKALAQDLEAEMRTNSDLRDAVAVLLKKTEALPVALEAVKDTGEDPTHLLKQVQADLQQISQGQGQLYLVLQSEIAAAEARLARKVRRVPAATSRRLRQDQARATDEQHVHAWQQYLQALHKYCNDFPYLSLDVLLGQNPRTLSEVYVPLRAWPRPQAENVTGSPQGNPEKTSPPAGDVSIAEVLHWATSGPTPGHLLIRGAPGAGKSTLLRQIAAQAWDNPAQIGLTRRYLPLLVPLQALALAEGAALETRLAGALDRAGELPLIERLPEDFFSSWPRQLGAPWLLLLDGLDEVPSDQLARLFAWLEPQVETIAQQSYCAILTARLQVAVPPPLAQRLAIYELQPFTLEQQARLARAWLGEQADAFLHELSQVRAAVLGSTPLLLTIAAAVFARSVDGRLPPRRASLYGAFVDIWLQEAARLGLGAEMPSELRDNPAATARACLQRLALWLTENPDEQSAPMLNKLIADYLQDKDGWDLAPSKAAAIAPGLVTALGRRSGLWRWRGGIGEWAHPTFREYLVAAELAQRYNPADKQAWVIQTSWRQKGWREIVLFLLGIWGAEEKGDVSRPLLDIAMIGDTNLLFAGEALAEGAPVTSPVEEKIITWLLNLARYEFVHILSRLRGRDAVTKGLQALMVDSTVAGYARAHAGELLAELGQPREAVTILQTIAADSAEYAWVREAATAALDRLARGEGLAATYAVRENAARWSAAALLERHGYDTSAAQLFNTLGFEGQLPVDLRVSALYKAGALYIKLNQLELAWRCFETLTAIAPGEAYAWDQLGSTLNELGKTAEAIPAYQQALALDPASPLTHNNLADVLLERGNLNSASWHYRERVRLRPADALNAQSSLGVIAWAHGDVDGAHEHFQAALAVFNEATAQRVQVPAGLHENRALALLGLGQVDESEAALREALAANSPDKPRTMDARWRLLLQSPHPPTGLDRLERLWQETVTDPSK